MRYVADCYVICMRPLGASSASRGAKAKRRRLLACYLRTVYIFLPQPAACMKPPPTASALPCPAGGGVQPMCVCAYQMEAPIPLRSSCCISTVVLGLLSACSKCKVHKALLSHLQIPVVRTLIQVRLPVAGLPHEVALPAPYKPLSGAVSPCCDCGTPESFQCYFLTVRARLRPAQLAHLRSPARLAFASAP